MANCRKSGWFLFPYTMQSGLGVMDSWNIENRKCELPTSTSSFVSPHLHVSHAEAGRQQIKY